MTFLVTVSIMTLPTEKILEKNTWFSDRATTSISTASKSIVFVLILGE